MKVLFLCNLKPKKVADITGDVPSTLGGWLNGPIDSLIENGISVVCMFPDEKIYNGTVNMFSYYSFAENDCKDLFRRVLEELQPDIVHIWGTEFDHTLYMIEACKCVGLIEKCVVSIQGLVSVCAEHYYDGIPDSIAKKKTLRDLIKNESIYLNSEKYRNRGQNEIKAIKNVCQVIGRTDWDEACSLQINPSLRYYRCNETLRNAFYSASWNIESVRKHSIFTSQSKSPIKGFYHIIQAVAILKKKYPDIQLFTTGRDIIHLSRKEVLFQTSYVKYLRKQIWTNSLQNNVTFLGILNENEMCQQYVNAHVFALPSNIENSPNSLGEAMLVGCPSVAADVGGVKDLMTHKEEGFIYQCNAPYMLAYYIDKLFSDDSLSTNFSQNAKKRANFTYNAVHNYEMLMNIYEDILLRSRCNGKDDRSVGIRFKQIKETTVNL